MAWVRFTANFDWTPPSKRAVTVAYRGGTVLNVPAEAAAAAIAAGKAEPREQPATRDEAAAVEAEGEA